MAELRTEEAWNAPYNLACVEESFNTVINNHGLACFNAAYLAAKTYMELGNSLGVSTAQVAFDRIRCIYCADDPGEALIKEFGS